MNDASKSKSQLLAELGELRAAVAALGNDGDSLAASEERYRDLFENMAQGAFFQRADGQLTLVNGAALEMFGLTLDQFLGRTSLHPGWRVVREDGTDLPGKQHPSMVALETGKAVKDAVTGIFNPASETFRWLSINAVPRFRGSDDKPFEVLVTLHDITETIRTQSKLEKAKAFTNVAVNALVDTFFVFDPQTGKALFWNKAFNLVSGYSDDEIATQKAPDTYYDEEDLKKAADAIKGFIETGRGTVELSLICKDARRVPTEYTASTVSGPGGQSPCLVAVGRDLTERVHAREEVLQSERKFRELFLHMAEGVALHNLVFDGDGNPVDYVIDDVSPAFETHTGLSGPDIVGRLASQVYGTGEPPYLETYAQVALSGHPTMFETYFPPLNKHFAISVFSPEKNRFATVFSDITERKDLAEALRTSEERLRAVFDNTPVCLNLKDTGGRYLLLNKPYEEWLGFPASEITGKKASEFMEDTVELDNLTGAERRVLETGEVFEREVRVLRTVSESGAVLKRETEEDEADADAYHRILIKYPVKSADGTVTAIGTVALDISERKRAEERLRQALTEAQAANRSKTQFLANMSHELRTPLNSIIGFAEMLESGVADHLGPDKAKEYISDIKASGTHLLRVIKEILDVSKIEAGAQDLAEENIGLREVADSCARIINERAINASVTMSVDVPDDFPALWVDATLLRQVLLNLLSNAVKFTPEGGHVNLSASLVEGGSALLAITDTGIGIAEEEIEKVFEPFAQVGDIMTRGHEGTGLGLSLAKALTELHGGTLEMQSRIGIGTTVTVCFPAERVIG